ncbi:hypothetical protein [Jeotgalibacillus haloalkalitolerans]|uniref:Helicase HerA central domain-containing protein n=1 Tax=Jeotgalibacillus haloalkalitolerans TaxID=3104292 RepID=A0ABU5KJB2_9BACL|nr:hypothetical protein [Jeotgalibacillus sp. HH7-29]MDZ5711352.1 hypothetical protein [Jeotgalibacillus sp. HH7-29]
MRQSFKHLFTGVYSDQLKDIRRMLDDNQPLLYVEYLLYAVSKCLPDRPIDGRLYPLKQVDVVMLGQPEYFVNETLNSVYYQHTLFLMQPEYDRYAFNSLAERYFNLPSHCRLYDLVNGSDGIKWVVKSERCAFHEDERTKMYDQILEDRSVIAHKESNLSFISAKDKYSKIIFRKGQRDIVKDVNIYPEEWLKDQHSFILTDHIREVQKNKSPLSFQGDTIDLKELAEELSEKTGKNYYKEVVQQISLESLQGKSVFSLNEVTHLIGRTGSGKSVIRDLVVYYAKKNGKKITFLEHDVNTCLELKKHFESLGLKSAVFLSDKKQNHYMNQYAGANMKGETLFDWFAQHREMIDTLDTGHYTRTLKKHITGYDDPQLKVMVEDDEKKSFRKAVPPDYDKSASFKRIERLIDADIWIGNYASFLRSKVPFFADHYERTYLEVAWLRSDLLVVDEYDFAQQQFDHMYIEKLDLVAAGQEYNKSFIDELTGFSARVNKHVADPFARSYIQTISNAAMISRHLYGSHFQNHRIVNAIRDGFFSPEKLLYQWRRDFIEESGWLIEWDRKIMNPVSKSGIFEELFQFYSHKDPQKYGILSETDLINRLIAEMQADGIRFNEKSLSQQRYMTEMLAFIVCLSYLHQYTGVLISGNQVFMNMVPGAGEAYTFLPGKREPYIPAPLIPNLLLYRLTSGADGRIDKMELAYYTGTGREVLSRLPELFRHIETTPPPDTIFLSATSYMPGSSFSHTEIKPDWLIVNKNQSTQKIHLFYNPVMERAGDELKAIYVSGQRDEWLKKDAIQNLIRLLELNQQFAKDLKRMNDGQAYKRMIGFPVPSYKLADQVGQALLKKGNMSVRVLYKEGKNERPYDSEIHLFKHELTDLQEHTPDCFVFVTSAIGRAVNLMQKNSSDHALIGTMYFLIRPYPVPEQIEDILFCLHSQKPVLMEECLNKSVTPLRGWQLFDQVHKKTFSLYGKLLHAKGFWRSLSDNQKEMLAKNILAEMMQTIGRGFRGRNELTVYLCDAAFAKETAGSALPVHRFRHEPCDSIQSSLLAQIEYLLTTSADPLLRHLYEPLIDTIDGIALKKNRRSWYDEYTVKS